MDTAFCKIFEKIIMRLVLIIFGSSISQTWPQSLLLSNYKFYMEGQSFVPPETSLWEKESVLCFFVGLNLLCLLVCWFVVFVGVLCLLVCCVCWLA